MFNWQFGVISYIDKPQLHGDGKQPAKTGQCIYVQPLALYQHTFSQSWNATVYASAPVQI